MKFGAFFCLLLLLASCAARRPVLYPNEQWHRVGPEVAKRDVDECMAKAEEFLASESRGAEVAERAALGAGTGAAVGAAGGAAGGAVAGHAGRGAAVGAAAGGAAGATRGLLRGIFRSREPGPTYQKFVNRCLREKGYEPVGWK